MRDAENLFHSLHIFVYMFEIFHLKGKDLKNSWYLVSFQFNLSTPSEPPAFTCLSKGRTLSNSRLCYRLTETQNLWPKFDTRIPSVTAGSSYQTSLGSCLIHTAFPPPHLPFPCVPPPPAHSLQHKRGTTLGVSWGSERCMSSYPPEAAACSWVPRTPARASLLAASLPLEKGASAVMSDTSDTSDTVRAAE